MHALPTPSTPSHPEHKTNDPQPLPSGGRLSALDGLRGFAVLIVLFDHTLHIPAGGYFGVDVFFVLSGFLISSQLFAEGQRTGTLDLRRFFIKRCRRLLPAFFAMCALYWIIDFCFLKSTRAPEFFRLFSLLFTSNLHLARGSSPYPLLNHTWTLAVEWQFYLLWPFVVVLLAKLGFKKTSVLGVLATAILVVWFLRLRGDTYIRYDGVLIGSALALAPLSGLRWLGLKAQAAVPAVFAACVLCLLLLIFKPTLVGHQLGISVAPLLAGAIILIAVSRRNWLSTVLLENTFLARFGKISYGLYLYHFPIAALMYTQGYTLTQMTLVCVPLSVALAIVSWRHLEEPLLQARRTNGPAGGRGVPEGVSVAARLMAQGVASQQGQQAER
jgi:peptidoglycan/LPS O-acetylase OafA/YrhL